MDMKKYFIGTLAVGCMLVGSCSSDEPGGGKEQKIQLTPEEQVIADGTADFQYEFFCKTIESQVGKDENMVVSPFSAQMVFSMIANGASEETKKELMDMLNCDDLSALNSYHSRLISFLPYADSKVKTTLANSVWYNDYYELNDGFSSALTNGYDATACKRDFKSGDKVVKEINRWCADNTDGRITEMVNNVNPDLMMVLLNAFTFDGEWTKVFKEESTKRERFYGSVSNNIVDMMHITEYLQFIDGESFKAACKSFGKNSEFSAWFILPDEEDAVFSEVAEDFSKALLVDKDWFNVEVSLGLPKLNISSREIDLKGVLRNMGVEGLFSESEFVPFTQKVSGSWLLAQSCTIEFDEHGAKAAAVTKGEMWPTAIPPLDHRTLILDRPFMFVIQNESTGAVLVAGKIMNL